MTLRSLAHRIYSPLYIMVRDDIGFREKWVLVASFFFLLIQRFWKKKDRQYAFLDYHIEAPSHSNLGGILNEIFLIGDYLFRPRSDAPSIIDCGANIGISILYFKRYYPKAKILAFEASKATFETLSRNMERNLVSGVELVNAAVAKEEGEHKFWHNPGNPGSSTATEAVYKSKLGQSGYEVIKTRATRLSTYISGDIDLLKMDIEGGEGEVLEELENSGKLGFIRELIFEYHFNLHNDKNSLSKICGLLERSGFTIIVFNNEFGFSSEMLKKRAAYHFMIRAYRATSSFDPSLTSQSV